MIPAAPFSFSLREKGHEAPNVNAFEGEDESETELAK
jgi:hypothetical protein